MSLAWQHDDWRARGACLGADPDLFFPISQAGPGVAQAARAIAVCRGCAVRLECAEFALAHSDMQGIWGGTTDDERKRARRNRVRAGSAARREAGTTAGTRHAAA